MPLWQRALPTFALAALICGVAVPWVVDGDGQLGRDLVSGLVLGVVLAAVERVGMRVVGG